MAFSVFFWGQGCIWLREIHFASNPAFWSRTTVQVATRSSNVICHFPNELFRLFSIHMWCKYWCRPLRSQFDRNYNLTWAEMPWPSVHLSHSHSHFLGMNTTGTGLCIPSPTTSFQGRNIGTPQLIIGHSSFFQLYFQAEIHHLKYTRIPIMKLSFKISVFFLKQSSKLLT